MSPKHLILELEESWHTWASNVNEFAFGFGAEFVADNLHHIATAPVSSAASSSSSCSEN